MARDIDPSSIALTSTQVQRLSKVSGIDVAQLSGLTVKEISDKLGHRIDPQLLLFRRICGTVVKTDPVTGIAYPVPYATVEVEDTDCSLLGYFPSSSPWSWFFPFSCRREVIGTTTTDECGQFCVWVPRWEIDWIIKWQAQKVCFPVIFQRPDLRDILEQLQLIPRPVPQPDPGPIRLDPRRRFEPDVLRRGIDLGALAGPATDQFDLRSSVLRTALTEALGDRLAKRVIALSEPRSFADDVPDFTAPAFGRDLRPPLPADLRAALLDDDHAAEIPASVKQLAAKLNIAVEDLAGLDLRRAIGPFKRCVTVFLPEWSPILDVPDITFRVSQDTNGDGVEEPIYSESYFQVRWNSGSISNITIEADPNALAGRLCREDDAVPCGDVPAVVMVGRLPVADVPDLYDPVAGVGLRTNRPHPGEFYSDPTMPKPPAASPLTGVLSMFGCIDTDPTATHYRLMFEFSADDGASYGPPTPFRGLTWPLFRLDGAGHSEWHWPMPDADGWYPIALPAGPNPWLPQSLVLDWNSAADADGLYRVTLQLGTGGTAVTQSSAAVGFAIDNSGPRGPLTVDWSTSPAGPFTPLVAGSCPVVHRGNVPVDTYFRVTLDASASHLRSAALNAGGCGIGDFEFQSGTGGVRVGLTNRYEHWHTSTNDNDQLMQVVYRLPATTAEGTYTVSAEVQSRAFSPNASLYLNMPTWEGDSAPNYVLPSFSFSVFNS